MKQESTTPNSTTPNDRERTGGSTWRWLERLRPWRQSQHGSDPTRSGRWLVLDTETTGLDAERDQLLAIGAVALSDGLLQPQDCFESLVQAEGTWDEENVLIHRIGVQARTSAMPAAQVLAAFQAWVGDGPLFAFHAPFDARVLQRGFQQHLKSSLPHKIIDIAALVAAVEPSLQEASLDEALAHAGIDPILRHSAIGDAFCSALLLQWTLGRLPVSERHDWRALAALERNARWLGR